MAATRPRPYRRILTSTLHRRFVHASAFALLVCYIVAFFIGVKSSFLWSWLPFGACGVRTLLLFVSSLAVFVLRVGQMHIGQRATSSPFGTFKHLFPLHVAQTFGWYLFSAWWFSEVYVWSSSDKAQLGWVKPARPYERISLNERPIYLHSYHMLLAVLQSLVHLYLDQDRLDIPVAKPAPEAADQRTHPVQPVVKRIQRAIPQTVLDSFARSVLMTLAGPIIYGIFLRRTAWSLTLYFAKLFWNFPRSAADPPGLLPPLHLSLLFRCLTSGGLLLLLWQTANLAFSSFLAQEPLKRGQPLTTETKDPNGSLLNGLKAKKETVKTFAFWELCFISQRFPDRRKAIFNDIDRDGGAAWSQILNASTDMIKGITTRINDYKNPPSAAAPQEDSQPAEKAEPAIKTLPRLANPPKEENVFAASPKGTSRHEKFGEAISTTAKSYGQSPDWTPTARAKARDMLDRASTAVLSPERKQKLLESSQELKMLTGADDQKISPEKVHPFIAQILRSPVGQIFRQSYARRLRSIVLGRGPYSDLSPIIDATESLTRLLVASLAEDPFGKVQADVPAVVRLFTETIMTLDDFVNGAGRLDVHWTDVTFPPSSQPEAQAQARRVPDVELVLTTLKTSLAELLNAFKLYLSEVGVKGKDLRLAREAAGLTTADEDKDAL